MDEKVEIKQKEEEKVPATVKEQTTTVVLKLDMHCEGCAKKIKRSVSHFEGVEKVKAEFETKKLTVIGSINPTDLRDRVEYKTKKKVEILSPQPKINASGGADKKKQDQKKVDDEAIINTIVMKIKLHCDGCANKIKRHINKYIDGANSVTTDLQKDLVTVIGTMNVKEMVSILKEKLKRGIEIVPSKKEGGKGTEKKKDVDGGDEKKKKGNGGREHGNGSGENGKIDVNKMEFQRNDPQTYFAMPMDYQRFITTQDPDTGYITQGPSIPPPTFVNVLDDQMFSDENPNGCFIM